MTDIFLTYLGISASVGIAILIILLASPLINRRYAAKWKYFIWIFLAVRLLVPLNGMYHKASEAHTVNQDIQSGGPAVYEPAEVQDVQPRRFVVEIPVEAAEQIVLTPQDADADKKISLFDAALAVWAAGAVIFAAIPIVSCMHYKRKITKHGEKIFGGNAFAMIEKLKTGLGIKSRITAVVYPQAASPMIIGFIRPLLVLPCIDYSPDELYFIIRHELIHLKRGDVYLKLLFVLANAVHWFNPLVWVMRREAGIDMELSCDERVVGGAELAVKKAYTETLISSIYRRSLSANSLTTQFNGGKKTMKKRFKNILGRNGKKNGIVVLICAVIAVSLLGIMVGCTKNQPVPNEIDLIKLINSYLDFEAIATYDNLPADFSTEFTAVPDSAAYGASPVIEEGMTTWKDWENYLSGIFTENGVSKALEMTEGRYINQDGMLYYRDGGMGWTLSNEYSIAKTTGSGSNTFIVEIWREYDPDFCESGEREFEITTISYEYTSKGWRIADFSSRASTPSDSNPNLASYNPFKAANNNADPQKDAVTLANEALTNLESYYRTVVNILTMRMTEPVELVEGVDILGNMREIDGVSYIPMKEEYDTLDEIIFK